MQIAAASLVPPAPVMAAAPDASPSVASAPDAPSTAAVTVTLSDAATATMAPPAVGGSDSGIVAQVEQLAGVLADSSGASNADKASALASLYQLRFESGGGGTQPSLDAWFTQSTPAQQQAVANQIDDSTFFKQAVGAAAQFNSVGIAAARAGAPFDFSKTEYARFGQLSSDQQLLVWAGGGSQFGTLDAFKSYLQQQAQGQAATNAAAIAQTNAAAAAPDVTDPGGAAEAVKTLSTKPAGTAADVALTMLTRAATARAAQAHHHASQGHRQTPSTDVAAASAAPATTTTPPYQPGAAVSVAA